MVPELLARLTYIDAAIQRIEENLSRYRTVFGSDSHLAPSQGLLLDEQSHIVDIGEDVSRLLGFESEQLRGTQLSTLVPDHMKSAEPWPLLHSGELKPHTARLNLLDASGYEVPVRFVPADTDDPAIGENHQATDGSPRQSSPGFRTRLYRFLVEDGSGRRRLEDELDRLRQDYQTLADTVTDAIIRIDDAFRIHFVNAALETMFGYERDELVDASLDTLFPHSREGQYKRNVEQYFFLDDLHSDTLRYEKTLEVLGLRRNGDVFPLEISLRDARGEAGERVLTCIFRDITERKNDERRMKFLAYHDQLTALGNRDMLDISLNQLLAEVERQPERHAALLFLDLDGFKKVNDSLGHESGDAILQETAQRLNASLRENDQVYRLGSRDIFRLGGDEFTVLLRDIQRPEDAAVVAARIIEQIREPYRVEGSGSFTHVSMGVSIGVALIPEDGTDKTTVLRNADAAMYTAKELGNNYAFFRKDMNRRAMERLFLEDGLRKSLQNPDLELYYQPICDSHGATVGLEALLRWAHPDRGVILPGQFIPLAEDNRMILEIGRWVLERALTQGRHWEKHGLGTPYICVNVSPKQLEQDDMPGVIHDVLERSGFPANRLSLELTESSIMQDPDRAIRQMQSIIRRNPGIHIAVDDFGTGYSSLSYLSRFPVTMLKIDKSFVRELHVDNNTKIVNTIIGLGRSLGLRVVAEGVEQARHFDYLRARECSGYQGFYFSPPMSFSEMTRFLETS
jgi:diguanylate cyclase (GGDEF)-like protein/PAS domain S-box-containing protein